MEFDGTHSTFRLTIYHLSPAHYLTFFSPHTLLHLQIYIYQSTEHFISLHQNKIKKMGPHPNNQEKCIIVSIYVIKPYHTCSLGQMLELVFATEQISVKHGCLATGSSSNFGGA